MIPVRVLLATALLVTGSVAASAHFQQLLPDADVLPDGGKVRLEMLFTHPMERGPVMEMARPKRFGVLKGGKTIDLLPALSALKRQGKTGWSAAHDLKRPGAAVFFVEPQPYWEPAEGKYIIHYAKVIVDAFASGEGWDAMAGLPVEIEPLVRPTGIWAGNVFRGIVRRNGKPVPFAEIEVEHVNDGTLAIPNEAFITQVIKADANGVFTYAMPRAGWWGFAALVEADKPMKSPQGKDAPVELGGLVWIRATAMKAADKPKTDRKPK